MRNLLNLKDGIITNLSSLVRPVDLHLPVESVVEEEVVGHAHPVGLHRVALAVVVVANVAW